MYIKGLYELKLNVQALKDKLEKTKNEIDSAKTSNKQEVIKLKDFEDNIEDLEYMLVEFEKDMKEVE